MARNTRTYLGREIYQVGISWYLRSIGPVPVHLDRRFDTLAGVKAAIKVERALGAPLVYA